MLDATVTNPAFERAFIAVSYLCGQRGETLTAPLSKACVEAQKLSAALSNPDRNQRAAALGRELTRIADALAARAY